MTTDSKFIGLLTVVALAACLPFFFGSFYLTGDMRDVIVPLETFFHEQTLQGHLPSWNPDMAWGFPVIAAAQIGFFYPPLLLLRFLPVAVYLPMIVLIHLVATAIGSYLFLRRQKIGEMGALFGSLAFTFSAFLWQHSTHLNIVLAIAWLPWTLLAAHQAAQSPRTIRSLVIFGLTIGMPMLIGQLQVPLLIALMALVYLINQLRQRPKILLVTLALSVVIGVGISAAQWLPTLELIHYSSRGPNGDFDILRANQHSYPLYHLPTAVWPRWYGSDATYWGKRLEIEYGFFIGTLPLLLALWTGWRYRHPQRFWLWTAGVTFALALGGSSPFRLIGIEPSLWVFSAPARWLLFTTFGLSVLAAAGFDRLHEAAERKSFSRYVSVIAISLIGVILIGNIALVAAQSYRAEISTSLTGASYYQTKIADIINQAAATTISGRSYFTYLPLVAVIACWYALRSKQFKFTFMGITIVELLIIVLTTSPLGTWKNLYAVPDTVKALPAKVLQKQARIFSVRAGGDTGAYFTDPASRANAAIRQEQQRLLVPLSHTLYGIAGVEWPASLDVTAATVALSSIRGEAGYVITDVTQAERLNIGAILMPVKLGTIAGRIPTKIVNNLAIYDLKPQPRANIVLADGSTKPAEYQEISPTEVHITAHTTENATLVIRDTWYPGWQATVNGQPVAIQAIQGLFRSVTVPAGDNTVIMKYVPTTLYTALAISLLSFLLTLPFLLFKKLRILQI